MQKDILLKLTPSDAADDLIVNECIARSLGKEVKAVTGFYRLKQSPDNPIS